MDNVISVTRVLMVSPEEVPGLWGALGSPFLLSWPQEGHSQDWGLWVLGAHPLAGRGRQTVKRSIPGSSLPVCLSSTGPGLTVSPHSAIRAGAVWSVQEHLALGVLHLVPHGVLSAECCSP